MKDILKAKFIEELGDITMNMYSQGWDERNGGNISYLLYEEDLKGYLDLNKVIRKIPLGFKADEIVKGKIFLVTGTGKYFKNVKKDPETNLGIVRISSNLEEAELLWGYKDGGKFTSEFPAHLMSHASRLKVDPNHRVIMHTHPTYTICMGACLPTDDLAFTSALWHNNTEAIVVFPDGIGVLPCMICGTNEIGIATAKKMENFRLVSWTNHGIYGSGKNIDEAFGLIETVEKTAKIYMLTLGHAINTIPDEVLKGLAKLWNLTPIKGILKEDE